MDLDWIRDGSELLNAADPEKPINGIFELLRDCRDDEATAAAIDKVEREWREFEKVWNGRWDQEPKDWPDPDARRAQRTDARHVALHLRNVLWRLREGRGGNELALHHAWLAAQALAAREKRLADLRSGPSGVTKDAGPVL